MKGDIMKIKDGTSEWVKKKLEEYKKSPIETLMERLYETSNMISQYLGDNAKTTATKCAIESCEKANRKLIKAIDKYEETKVKEPKSHLKCPHCDGGICIRYEPSVNVPYSQKCIQCEKTFCYKLEPTTLKTFTVYKVDCLNGNKESHNWEPEYYRPVDISNFRMVCIGCLKTRKPTEDEWDFIKN